MPAGAIRTQVDGHVLHVIIDRTDKRNAVDRAMLRALAEAYTTLDRDDSLRVGVLQAEGAHFSAGLELTDVGPAVAAGEPMIPEGLVDPFGVWGPSCRKPVVMAVQGIAFTLSIELALNADVVIAANDVRFNQLEVARGITPFGGATVRAVTNLGWGNAMRFLLTAEDFGADEALRIGLVQEVVLPAEVRSRAVAVAGRIAAQAPLGVQATLRQSRLARDQGAAAAIADMRDSLQAILRSRDASEGLRSFVERREGRFEGR